MMEYNGYIAKIEYDNKEKSFFGKVINTNDVITFEGKSVSSLEKDFKGAINFYIDLCKKKNKKPEKPFSGKFIVRVKPNLHRKAIIGAIKKEVSLNKFVENAIVHELEKN